MNSLSNFQIPDVWEVKDVVNKLKNVVLNYTEMEAKVHEATNNEPWGASTTLMQEIAQGTYNYQYFNEIMPTIYRRFTEKESKQWRQIYKALVLLEFLVKNGSERVVDDARGHVSMIKVLRNFYYIDEKGKDEGINIRNRAKEVIELLSNTDKIRSERKLAKKNKNKYVGVSSEGGTGSSSASTSRYAGFGSEIFGSRGGGISFNGDNYNFDQPSAYSNRTGKYDEDEFDDDGAIDDDDQFDSKPESKDDDDDWGEFTWGEPVQQQQQQTKSPAAATTNSLFDDDFADFQQASNITTSQKQPDLFDLLSDNTPQQPAPQQPPLNVFETKQPIVPIQQQQQQQQPIKQEPVKQEPEPTKEPDMMLNTGMWAQASNFVSLDSLGKKVNTAPTTGPSMNSLKTNSVKNDWNNWANSNQTNKPSSKSAFDDLLF